VLPAHHGLGRRHQCGHLERPEPGLLQPLHGQLFAAAYDEHLDKMLPQFPHARAHTAPDIIEAWDGGVQPINLM
jgi:hypothetical protein